MYLGERDDSRNLGRSIGLIAFQSQLGENWKASENFVTRIFMVSGYSFLPSRLFRQGIIQPFTFAFSACWSSVYTLTY